jgi:multidrug resistance efflux pump
MKRLYILCAVLIGLLAALTAYYRAEPDTFYGIADTKEIAISSESAVEIRRIAVAQGEMVAQGDTLLELHNPELEMRLSQISHELKELRARKTAHATLSKSEILQLKAQQAERVSEIRAEIKELEAQYEINKQLVSELRSLDRDKGSAAGANEAKNPVQIKLESLRQLLVLVQDPSRVYEGRLANALSSEGDPLIEQVSQREDELRILNEDRKRLIILAQIGGLIGSVSFKVGEKVSPFTPILTLHAASPSFVRGYIHEDVYSQVAVKQKVRVQSNQNRRHNVEGVVVGVGARIVEYPERLRKRADILIWGREIIIRLPPDNKFLLGEKVLISLPGATGIPGAKRPVGSVSAEPADAGSPTARDIQSPPAQASAGLTAGLLGGATDVPGIEASGLLFLPDLKRFLVISDETAKHKALVHLMDTAYKIEKTVPVRGLDKMDDMEAVAEDGAGSIYILSSQSYTKKGKLPDHRKLLIKTRRKGDNLELQGKIVLIDALEKASRADAGKDWAAFLRTGLAAESIDIEGMAVLGGDVYLGFKAPLLDGKAVILRLSGIDSLMAGKALAAPAVSIWKTLDLKDARTSTACGISDFIFLDGNTYLLSTGTRAGSPGAASGSEDDRHAGSLWVLRKDAAKPVELRDFAGAKPEGLAHVAADKSFYVAFDNGSKRPSQVLRIGATL